MSRLALKNCPSIRSLAMPTQQSGSLLHGTMRFSIPAQQEQPRIDGQPVRNSGCCKGAATCVICARARQAKHTYVEIRYVTWLRLVRAQTQWWQ